MVITQWIKCNMKSMIWIMLVEPKGVVNTGNEVNELTAKNDQWI